MTLNEDDEIPSRPPGRTLSAGLSAASLGNPQHGLDGAHLDAVTDPGPVRFKATARMRLAQICSALALPEGYFSTANRRSPSTGGQGFASQRGTEADAKRIAQAKQLADDFETILDAEMRDRIIDFVSTIATSSSHDP